MPRPVWSWDDQLRARRDPGQAVPRRAAQERVVQPARRAHDAAASATRRCPPRPAKRCPTSTSSRATRSSKGRYVVVDPDELEPFIPSATKTRRPRGVRRSRRDRSGVLRHAVLRRPDTNPKPYVLLARAMEESGKVAIGRFVMRNKQYTAAIRAQDGRLVMSTLAYADEVVDPATIDELEGLDEIDVSAKEVKMAEALVESLTADFEPDEVPRRLPRAGARPDPQEGCRRGVRGARGRRREAEGRRPDGGARGQRQGGQAGPRPPSGRRPPTKTVARKKKSA